MGGEVVVDGGGGERGDPCWYRNDVNEAEVRRAQWVKESQKKKRKTKGIYS